MKAERLGALTDGIVAIAATIMVLELAVPNHTSITGILDQWPTFLAHFNSFFLIYILWFNHYMEMKKLTYVSGIVFLLNGVWLAYITLIPFGTGWVSDHPAGTLPQLVYLLNLGFCYLFDQLIFYIISREKTDLEIAEENTLRARIPIYIGLIISMVVAFFYPALCFVIVFVIVLYNVYLILKYYGKEKSY